MRATDAAETEITGDSLWSRPGAPRKTTVLNRNLTPQCSLCIVSKNATLQHTQVRAHGSMSAHN